MSSGYRWPTYETLLSGGGEAAETDHLLHRPQAAQRAGSGGEVHALPGSPPPSRPSLNPDAVPSDFSDRIVLEDMDNSTGDEHPPLVTE